MSPSSRRAWIEITAPRSGSASHGVALLAEGVDRNPCEVDRVTLTEASPSSRRAWIEIWSTSSWWRPGLVALLAEGVDRNQLVSCACARA